MIRNPKRCISLVLVLVLLVGMIPTAYATETESTTPEETTSEVTEATNPTEPTEPTAPPEGGDVESENLFAISGAEDFAVMSIGSTQGSIMLFDFADNGNYTTVLNSQVSCTYKPNGTGTTRTAYIKNLGWHFARYGGVAHADEPLYCIEPWRSYGASTSGNSVDRDVTLDGSGTTSGSNVWYALPEARREAIGLILLYSNNMWDHSISVTTTKKDSNPNVPLRIATQFLIYEIVCGLRDPDTFERNYTNECGTSGDVFYNAGSASVSGFSSNYNTLVSNIQAAKKIPSFTSSSSGSAPTITLKGKETSVTDTNGVLGNWSFADGNGAEFYKSGNSLYITQTGTISESAVFKATRNLPSASGSTYSLWYMTGSSYQTTISLASPSNSNLNAYFKLKAVPQTGNLSLTKTTEDGKNLSGWRFGIYSNSACSSLVSGPHTTNSSGKISVTGLSAGTYYVKELGHTDSAIDGLYTCASTNPQKVTITAGQTASVSFQNKLNPGGLSLTKTTEDGKNLAGWHFGIYSDSGCTNLVSGPHTTDASGKISVTGLSAGTYYVKELGHTDSTINALYTCASTNPQRVTITTGQTASVSFQNNLYSGSVKIIKTMPDGGSITGWNFEIYGSDNKLVASVTTGKDGTILADGLIPGEYIVKEIIPEGSPYICDLPNPKAITIQAGQTAEVTFTNRLKPGEISIQKVDTRGNPLAGAEFLLEWSADGSAWEPVAFTDSLDVKEGTCTSDGLKDGKLTSGADGMVRFTGLHSDSLYRVMETKAPEGYQLLTEPVHEGSIQVGNEYFVQLTVVNAPVFELPMTGSMGYTVQTWLQITGALILLGILLYIAFRKRR